MLGHVSSGYASLVQLRSGLAM